MIKQIIAGILTISALGIGGITVKQVNDPNGLLQSSKRQYREDQRANSSYKQRTKDLTKGKVEASMAKDQVDLDAAKKDASDRVNNAIKTAYSGVTKDNYKQAKSDINKQVGPVFGKEIVALLNPHANIPYSTNLEEVKVGFGKYDISTYKIPMVITVKYKATDKSTTDSYDYWRVSYNAKTKEFSDVHYKAIIPTQNN